MRRSKLSYLPVNLFYWVISWVYLYLILGPVLNHFVAFVISLVVYLLLVYNGVTKDYLLGRIKELEKRVDELSEAK